MRKTGFSLVELLVVIAIIMILMGMVLAVGSKAMERARQVKCASNMHQIAVATTLYLEHHSKTPAGSYRPEELLLKEGLDQRIFRCPSYPENKNAYTIVVVSASRKKFRIEEDERDHPLGYNKFFEDTTMNFKNR